MRCFFVVSAVLSLLSACQCDDPLGVVPGRIDGQVCDAVTGAPLANVAVRLENDGAVVGTDGEGRYTFGVVSPGDDVVVVGVAAAARRFPAVVESGVSTVVVDEACRLVPAAVGTIEGQLCGLDGAPLNDALVSVFVDNADGTETARQGRTNADGTFRLSDVPAGERVLEVRSSAFARDFALIVTTGQTTFVPASLTCELPEVPPVPPPVPPPEEPPPEEPPPPPEEPPPACTPRAEVCENGVDENCDGIDNSCDPITLNLLVDGDCVTASCPASAPFPVGCDIHLQGGDDRGCVANTSGSSSVYFQEGDHCGSGRVTGTLFCSSFLPPEPLNGANCPINKDQQFHVGSPDQCPEVD